MPAKSKKQRMAAGAALSVKRGERSISSLKGASRQIAQSMSEKQLEEFGHSKRKGLPPRSIEVWRGLEAGIYTLGIKSRGL
jgi:Protein of unknwon function (DUF3008)